jgi:hypothetical protein
LLYCAHFLGFERALYTLEIYRSRTSSATSKWDWDDLSHKWALPGWKGDYRMKANGSLPSELPSANYSSRGRYKPSGRLGEPTQIIRTY